MGIQLWCTVVGVIRNRDIRSGRQHDVLGLWQFAANVLHGDLVDGVQVLLTAVVLEYATVPPPARMAACPRQPGCDRGQKDNGGPVTAMQA